MSYLYETAVGWAFTWLGHLTAAHVPVTPSPPGSRPQPSRRLMVVALVMGEIHTETVSTLLDVRAKYTCASTLKHILKSLFCSFCLSLTTLSLEWSQTSHAVCSVLFGSFPFCSIVLYCIVFNIILFCSVLFFFYSALFCSVLVYFIVLFSILSCWCY